MKKQLQLVLVTVFSTLFFCSAFSQSVGIGSTQFTPNTASIYTVMMPFDVAALGERLPELESYLLRIIPS